MSRKRNKFPDFDARQAILAERRALKMARSAHAYVRGNALRSYEWLAALPRDALPDGPPVWICGDCHVGNLGPAANQKGQVGIQIRDLDQTVIGNPAHDLIRLGLSLATAARGSDLPGVVTAQMVEQMIEGYEQAFADDAPDPEETGRQPDSVRLVMREALGRSWKHLARERLKGGAPRIPLGSRFWPLSGPERTELGRLFATAEAQALATALRSRPDDAPVEMVDAAYWMKGCSSLGRLRYAVLLRIGDPGSADSDLCLMDVKEAVRPAAPRHKGARIPRDNGVRVVEGARRLAPFLGQRMLAARLLDRAVFVRELLPQDLKLEIERLTRPEAMKAARFLALVVGTAHAGQMDRATRQAWLRELGRHRSTALDAPSWLWRSIVELVKDHEGGYLEHCRKFALQAS